MAGSIDKVQSIGKSSVFRTIEVAKVRQESMQDYGISSFGT